MVWWAWRIHALVTYAHISILCGKTKIHTLSVDETNSRLDRSIALDSHCSSILVVSEKLMPHQPYHFTALGLEADVVFQTEVATKQLLIAIALCVHMQYKNWACPGLTTIKKRQVSFHDHVYLCYCWPLDNPPHTCPCGAYVPCTNLQAVQFHQYVI